MRATTNFQYTGHTPYALTQKLREQYAEVRKAIESKVPVVRVTREKPLALLLKVEYKGGNEQRNIHAGS